MDIDAFVTEHEPQWNRLRELCAQSRSLTGAQADEVVELYHKTSTHLATVRGSAYDPELEARLSTLLANARSVVTATQPHSWRTVAHFFGAALPAAIYRLRWATVAVGAAALAITAIIAAHVIRDPEVVHAYLTDAQIDQLVNYDFSHYYSENPAQSWAFTLWLHNTQAAGISLLLGVLVVPTLTLLYANALNLGVNAGLLIGHGRGDMFWGLILPHGMLELTAFFLASAAGLRIAWAWIAPGPRPRSRALADAGRQMVIVAIGCALWLLISGCLEAFITPSGLPTPARVGIGALALIAFWSYALILGRRAVRAGANGDVDEAFRNATQPIEAAV